MKHYEEVFDAIARIDIPEERANQHLETVQSLYEHGFEESASAIFPETLTLIRQLDDPKKKLFLLKQAGTLLASRGKIAEAIAIAEEMELAFLVKELITSNAWKEEIEDARNALFGSISKSQAERGQLKNAIETADRVDSFHEYETALCDVLTCAVASSIDDITACEQIPNEIETPQNRVTALLALARLQHKFGLAEKIQESLAMVKKIVASEIEGEETQYAVIREIAAYYLSHSVAADHTELLSRLIPQSDASSDCCTIWLDLAEKQRESGNLDLAKEFLGHAIENDGKSDEKSFGFLNPMRIAEFFANMEQANEMKEYYRKAIAVCERESNSFGRVTSLVRVARSLAESGERGAAEKLYFRTIKLIESEDADFLRCMFVQTISESMLKDDFVESALNIIEWITEPIDSYDTKANPLELKEMLLHQKSLAFSVAAKILASKSDDPVSYETSQRLLRESTDIAHLLTDFVNRAEALRKIAEAAVSHGP